MKINILLLLVSILAFRNSCYSQNDFICPPCGMECDSTAYTEGGICPHNECHRILQWANTPSLLWPSYQISTQSLTFSVQSPDAISNTIYQLRKGVITNLRLQGENAKFSPNGKQLLYTLNEELLLHKNGSSKNLTTEADLDGGADWYSNEELIVTIGTFPNTQIYLYNLSSNEKTLFSTFKGFNYGPAVSKHGAVAFASLRKGLFIIPHKGVEPVLLHQSGEYATFSPDGKKVAFQVTENRRFSIYTANIDGTEIKKIKSVKGYDCEIPSWSKNGKEIYFMSNKRHGNWDIYKMKADGSNETLVLASEKVAHE